eukprot:g54912.t1
MATAAEEPLVISSDEEQSDTEVEVVRVNRASRTSRAALRAAVIARNAYTESELSTILGKRRRPSNPIDLTEHDSVDSEETEGAQVKGTSEATEEKKKPKLPETQSEILQYLKKNLECPVCQDSMRHPASTKCGHIFCYSCAKKWIDINNSCPSCRATLSSEDMHRIYL